MSKQKKGKAAAPPTKAVGGMGIARSWPVHEVLVARGWEMPGTLTSVLIARRSPNSGKIATGLFLVDLACLGVKSAQVKLFKDVAEYNSGLRSHAVQVQPMAPASFNLAAKILLSGLEYAANLGFKPDPVFAQGVLLLEGANPGDEPTPVPTGGADGKPLFINGPYDNVERVVAQLRHAVGDGNFNVILGDGGEGLYFGDSDGPDDIDDEPEARRLGG